MRFSRLIAAGFLGASLLFSSSNVLAAWSPSQKGLQLDDDAKQEYMAKRMDEFFNPKPDAEAKVFTAPKGWKYEDLTLGELRLERLTNPKSSSSKRVVLQLHGGGYVGGLTDLYREFAVKQAIVSGARDLYMVDYRLAPENKYPAALEDAVAAYKYLLTRSSAENIVVFGDSAGGNLALALAIYLKENNLPQPSMLILNSPWTTLETNLPSREYNADRDVVLGKKNPTMYGEVNNPSYGGNLPASDYHLSPMNADLSGLPPTLIQVGGYELLLDDGIMLAVTAADNLDVTLSVYKGMPHDFSLVLPELQDSVDSFREIQDFIKRHSRR